MAPSPDPIAAVSQRLDEFLAVGRAEVAGFGAEAALLLDAATRAVSGGKRLRARFCIAGWASAAGLDGRAGPVPGAVLTVAAALEIFHAAALVHDDIIDNSDTRRGRPAAHRRLEQAHRERGWTGDAPTFGRAGGILLGDLLVALSDDLLEEGLAALASSVGRNARAQYATMRRDVTVGQFLDIAEESAHASAPDEEHAARALRVASLKSARYSVEQPLLIGARLADAGDDQLRALSGFGHPIGMAFQLRDDVLGVFGDEAVTGKPAGDDLREGKRTALIAFTREALDPAGRRDIDDLVGRAELDGAQITMLQDTIRATGALDRVEALIAGYVQEAEAALAGARLGIEAMAELRDLADAATERTA